MQVAASTIPIAANQASRNSAVNVLNGGAVSFYAGSYVSVPVALFNGSPSADTFVNDLSNLTAANLVIRSGSVIGTVLVEKTILASAFNPSLTYAQWEAGTASHFTFQLVDTDTNQTPGAVYIAIDVVISGSGNIPVAICSNAQIINSGIGSAGTPTAANYVSYSQLQSDARYPLTSGNQLILTSQTTGTKFFALLDGATDASSNLILLPLTDSTVPAVTCEITPWGQLMLLNRTTGHFLPFQLNASGYTLPQPGQVVFGSAAGPFALSVTGPDTAPAPAISLAA